MTPHPFLSSAPGLGEASGTGQTPENDARVQRGAKAAYDLASHGYDPHSSADNQAMIQAIAGAVSCIPGAGPFLGGAVEALDALGLGIVKAGEALGWITPPTCTSSGDWTVSDWPVPPAAQTPGSPQAALWPMVAAQYANFANCQGSSDEVLGLQSNPGGIDPSTLYKGFAALWNTLYDGSRTVTFAVFPDMVRGAWAGAVSPYPAPGAAFVADWGKAWGDQSIRSPADFVYLTVNAGNPISSGGGVGHPITLHPGGTIGRIHGGGFVGGGGGITFNPPTPAPAPLSPALKVAVGAGAALGILALVKPALLRALFLKV